MDAPRPSPNLVFSAPLPPLSLPRLRHDVLLKLADGLVPLGFQPTDRAERLGDRLSRLLEQNLRECLAHEEGVEHLSAFGLFLTPGRRAKGTSLFPRGRARETRVAPSRAGRDGDAGRRNPRRGGRQRRDVHAQARKRDKLHRCSSDVLGCARLRVADVASSLAASGAKLQNVPTETDKIQISAATPNQRRLGFITSHG